MITPENARSYAVFVKQYAQNGEISAGDRPILQERQAHLKLTAAEAQAIEKRVFQLLAQAADQPTIPLAVKAGVRGSGTVGSEPSLKPAEGAWVEPREQQDTVERYEQEFFQALSLEFPPGELLRQGLKQSQETLGLTDEAVEAIESQATKRFQAQQEQYQEHLRRYEQAFDDAVALGLPFSEATQNRLVELQQSWELQDKDITRIEGLLLAQYFTQPQFHPSHLSQGNLAPTEFSDSPPTQVLAMGYSSTAPTAQPAELTSFIPAEAMPAVPQDAAYEQAGANAAGESISLQSEKDIDYSTLRDLLRQQLWLDADRETLMAMLKAANRTQEGWLDAESLMRLPCTDLHTIDRLWSHYSGGKFGFQAQWLSYPVPKRSRTSITNNMPSRMVHEQVLEFAKSVDWWTERMEFLKYYNQLTFSLDAPRGHLPALWFWTVPWWKALQNGGVGSGRGGCSLADQTLPTFMTRLRACEFE